MPIHRKTADTIISPIGSPYSLSTTSPAPIVPPKIGFISSVKHTDRAFSPIDEKVTVSPEEYPTVTICPNLPRFARFSAISAGQINMGEIILSEIFFVTTAMSKAFLPSFFISTICHSPGAPSRQAERRLFI